MYLIFYKLINKNAYTAANDIITNKAAIKLENDTLLCNFPPKNL